MYYFLDFFNCIVIDKTLLMLISSRTVKTYQMYVLYLAITMSSTNALDQQCLDAIVGILCTDIVVLLVVLAVSIAVKA